MLYKLRSREEGPMDAKSTEWHAPELTTLVRTGDARPLDMIYGGRQGEEGERCRPEEP